MIEFVSRDGYSVYVENDGDDMWVSVRHNGAHVYDCCVGSVDDGARKKEYIETAYSQFYPANYVQETLASDADRQRVLSVAKEAFRIDYALEMAMYL